MAGWKGTIGNITAEAIREMQVSGGADPSRVMAVLDPSIGACCYEVDEGRARLFVEDMESTARSCGGCG